MSNELLGNIVATKAAIFDCIKNIELETARKNSLLQSLASLEEQAIEKEEEK
jgi:hypothetical protein